MDMATKLDTAATTFATTMRHDIGHDIRDDIADDIGADALLPLLVWAVVHAPLPCGVATLAYAQRM